MSFKVSPYPFEVSPYPFQPIHSNPFILTHPFAPHSKPFIRTSFEPIHTKQHHATIQTHSFEPIRINQRTHLYQPMHQTTPCHHSYPAYQTIHIQPFAFQIQPFKSSQTNPAKQIEPTDDAIVSSLSKCLQNAIVSSLSNPHQTMVTKQWHLYNEPLQCK